jgi:hypothetical protein
LQIPELIRVDCINELRAHLPDHILANWVVTHQCGKPIGTDNPLFHLGAGMWARNILRRQLLDSELPGVLYSQHNKLVRNWDDYYLGAIQELIEASLITRA